jgi:hypothetical protein
LRDSDIGLYKPPRTKETLLQLLHGVEKYEKSSKSKEVVFCDDGDDGGGKNQFDDDHKKKKSKSVLPSVSLPVAWQPPVMVGVHSDSSGPSKRSDPSTEPHNLKLSWRSSIMFSRLSPAGHMLLLLIVIAGKVGVFFVALSVDIILLCIVLAYMVLDVSHVSHCHQCMSPPLPVNELRPLSPLLARLKDNSIEEQANTAVVITTRNDAKLAVPLHGASGGFWADWGGTGVMLLLVFIMQFPNPGRLSHFTTSGIAMTNRTSSNSAFKFCEELIDEPNLLGARL